MNLCAHYMPMLTGYPVMEQTHCVLRRLQALEAIPLRLKPRPFWVL